MNENNGGKGLFYGVIGVATLIVAIIGATFAWFTATAAGDKTTTVTSGNLVIEYTDSTTLVATNLKPATEDQVKAAYANNKCAHTGDAEAIQNNESVCSVYQFTVNNTGSLYAVLTAKLSDFAITTEADRNVNTGVTGDTGETAVTTEQEVTAGKFKYAVVATAPGTAAGTFTGASLASATDITLTSSRLAPAGNTTQYIVVWLDSTADNSYQAVSANAKVTVTAAQTNQQ